MVRVWYTVLVHTFCFIGNKENCIRSTRTFGAGMTSILVRTRSGLNALNCLNTLNWLNQQPNHLIGLTLRSLRVPSRLLAISTCCHGHCFLIKVLSVSLPPRLPLPLSPSLSLSPRLPLSPSLSLSLCTPELFQPVRYGVLNQDSTCIGVFDAGAPKGLQHFSLTRSDPVSLLASLNVFPPPDRTRSRTRAHGATVGPENPDGDGLLRSVLASPRGARAAAAPEALATGRPVGVLGGATVAKRSGRSSRSNDDRAVIVLSRNKLRIRATHDANAALGTSVLCTLSGVHQHSVHSKSLGFKCTRHSVHSTQLTLSTQCHSPYRHSVLSASIVCGPMP